MGSLNLLDRHVLSGTIPHEIGSLVQLKELSLIGDQLKGTIPPQLASLAQLTSLQISSNILEGSIPSELGKLDQLSYLSLSNKLTGEIPSELGNLIQLQHLILEDNHLEGNIPSELGTLTQLTNVKLRGNQLTGTIPSELGRLESLSSFQLAHNDKLDLNSIPRQVTDLCESGDICDFIKKSDNKAIELKIAIDLLGVCAKSSRNLTCGGDRDKALQWFLEGNSPIKTPSYLVRKILLSVSQRSCMK